MAYSTATNGATRFIDSLKNALGRHINQPGVEDDLQRLSDFVDAHMDQPGMEAALQRLTVIVEARGPATARAMINEVLRRANMMDIV
mgnify:CR=1 FL=1